MADARCRSRICGAPILWAKTINGKAIPLDATPDDAGNVTLDRDLLGGLVAHVHAGPTGPAGERYMPHHATCPAVEAFRG